ncbi:Carboxypeptidase Y inhibitor [Lachnellula subtilissima]|uniref:Carboxypeptidase Y inhibitor n=1 Tax=Lachnellula subtilissima TaxID=602034 RepID=A0A8H8U5G2_9HELO|nr:Carboxypeptidase Y inhibitor [Lachnellula subtilissima]
MQLTTLPSILLLVAPILTPSLAIPTDQILLSPSKEPTTNSKNDQLDRVRHALKKASIIPDVVDDFHPKCFILPTYGHGKHSQVVFPGKKLKVSKTKERPSHTVYCPDMKSTTGLIIALTDPDAPSRGNPKWSEMCHWIAPVSEAVKLLESDFASRFEFDIDAAKFEDLVKYKAPGPPTGTGYHRYVFILLEGPNTNLTLPETRQHWGTGKEGHGVRDWAKMEGLVVVGGNYFKEKQ